MKNPAAEDHNMLCRYPGFLDSSSFELELKFSELLELSLGLGCHSCPGCLCAHVCSCRFLVSVSTVGS